MPKADETQVVVELTPFSIRALRASGRTIEAAGECLLENKPGLEALLDAVSPSRKTEGFRVSAAVWPGSAHWHVSTDTEAMLDRSGDSFRTIGAADLDDPGSAFTFAVCNATDGKAVTADGTDKWVLASFPRDSHQKAAALLKDLNAVADGAGPAAFAAIGAVAAALRLEGKDGAVALWDIGSNNSSLVLVTARGAEAAVPCSVGMEKIFEAVQSALKLKFRGAGARLFFNEGYDFTEPGPKVGAAVGAALKESLAQLPTLNAPPALACLGLTLRQGWFTRESAAVAGIAAWAPDLGLLAAELGIKFQDAALAGALAPASAGIIQRLSSRVGSSEEWSPEWVEVEAREEEEAPAAAPVEEEPEPEPEPPPHPAAPAARPRPTISADAPSPTVTFSPKTSGRPPVPQRPAGSMPPPMPGPQSGSTRPPAQAPAPRPAAPPGPSAPLPSFPSPAPAGGRQPTFSNPGFPMPGGAPEPAGSTRPPSFSNPGFPAPGGAPPEPTGAPPRPPSFSNPGFPMPEAKKPPMPVPSGAAPQGAAPPAGGTTPPQPAVTALPFEAVKLKPLTAAQKAAALAEDEPPKSRVGFYIGLGVAASLVFAAIALVLEARMEKIKAYDLEQQEATAHHIAEEQLRQAEKDKQAEAAQKIKDIEAAREEARKQAEEETTLRLRAQMEAERLSKLPGVLVVATVPAGALVSIDGGAPLKSPVKLEGVAPGGHRVQISLAGHESADMNAEILGSKTTDLGTISLGSIFGTVELSSSPDNLDFAIRPDNDPAAKPVRTGRTPASYDDIPHGGYLVVFSRPGCADHTEKLTVVKAGKATVQTKYLDGSLELTSYPSGANVSKDGEFLGTTPLSLHDLTPKKATFDLTLPGFDPTTISCQIPEGDTLKYDAKLLLKDRIFKAAEVKTPPVSVEAPPPSLSADQRKQGADVVLSIVVRKNGTVTGVEVVRSTDDDIARRCKGAIEKWKFTPATAPDDRIVEARIEVPFKFPAGGK